MSGRCSGQSGRYQTQIALQKFVPLSPIGCLFGINVSLSASEGSFIFVLCHLSLVASKSGYARHAQTVVRVVVEFLLKEMVRAPFALS